MNIYKKIYVYRFVLFIHGRGISITEKTMQYLMKAYTNLILVTA